MGTRASKTTEPAAAPTETVAGGQGNDTISTGGSTEPGPPADTLTGGQGADSVVSGQGNDTIDAGGARPIPDEIEALPRALPDWTDAHHAAFAAWHDTLPEDETVYQVNNPAVSEAWVKRREHKLGAGGPPEVLEFASMPDGKIGMADELYPDAPRPAELFEGVLFRSHSSDLTGLNKVTEEVPAIVTRALGSTQADLTVFRAGGMSPIGVAAVRYDDRGPESPYQASWRRLRDRDAD